MNKAKFIFWDFDGVIKETIAVKTDAFGELFKSTGPDIVERIQTHHLANGGMSRFDKIPIYLTWAGLSVTEKRTQEYCDWFSELVLDRVITSAWVAGVEDYLRLNRYGQNFILVTATPHEEIEKILIALNLVSCFSAVFGAPLTKEFAIRETMLKFNLTSDQCLMVGDAVQDLKAANNNLIPFLLRSHPDNVTIFAEYSGPEVKDFIGL